MKNKKIKSLTLYAMFIAIEIALVSIPFLGFIPIGPLRATTLHIPVLIAGIVLGKKGGAIIGLVFGITSMLFNTINPTITSFVFSPFISGNILSAFIAIVPRILLGYLAGFLFEIISKKINKKNLSIISSCLMASIVHTVLVLSGIYMIFGAMYSDAVGRSIHDLSGYFIGIVGTQGILEAIVGAIITVAVSKPLLHFTKRG